MSQTEEEGLSQLEGEEDPWDDEDKDEDEDSLEASLSPISVDKAYLCETAADETDDDKGTRSRSFQRWKIDHTPGNFKYSLGRFIAKVLSSEFDGPQALEILQRRCTMNYGSPNAGSIPARSDNTYVLSYHLDFISVIGRPLRPTVRQNARLFDNVTISLQKWYSQYSAKHAKGVPADLTNRTFRLAEGSTREEWFIVMHPGQQSTVPGDDAAHHRRDRAKRNGGGATALARCHAEALAAYIKELFLDSTLLGEGVEACWKLGGKESQKIAFGSWVKVQELFVKGWPDFTRQHAYDRFWVDNQPAFHAYNYGGNIKIEVTQQLEALERETAIRPVDEDEDDDIASDEGSSDGAGDDDDDDDDDDIRQNTGEEPMSAHEAGGQPPTGNGPVGSVEVDEQSATDTERKMEDPVANRTEQSDDGVSSHPSGTERDASQAPHAEGQEEPVQEEDDLYVRDDVDEGSGGNQRVEESPIAGSTPDGPAEPDDMNDGLYSNGLRQLQVELEEKYNLDNVDSISYALAVNVDCVAPVAGRVSSPARSSATSPFPSSTPSPQPAASQRNEITGEVLCLLADRNRIAREYVSKGDFTFYPLRFYLAYRNFTSHKPLRFLARDQLAIIKDNMSFLNNGADILDFRYFQAYSNIKRSIRHSSEDLLATRGSATAALTIPASNANSRAQIRKKQQGLLKRLRGQLTPDNPGASTPFARERQRIQAAIIAKKYAFRFEQVVSINVKRLVPGQRTFLTVLYLIFQLIRFFLREKTLYLGVLRQFLSVAFPGVLAGFMRVFELALREMEEQFSANGCKGLCLALSEGVAALDRLGNFCFTGDSTVLPPRVLRPLKTMDSLREGGWPYISPDLLDLREGRGFIDLRRWPRKEDERPLLMHVASLAYHYGSQVATNRESQLWFAELGGRDMRGLAGTSRFVEEVFRELWDRAGASTANRQLGLEYGMESSPNREPWQRHIKGHLDAHHQPSVDHRVPFETSGACPLQ